MIKKMRILGLMVALMIVFGCTSNDPIQPAQAQNMNELEIPDGFNWDFTKNVEVNIDCQ